MNSTDAETGTVNDHLNAAEALLGMVFSTPKDLRHSAEQVLGQEFVPTECCVRTRHRRTCGCAPPAWARSTSTPSASATGTRSRSRTWTP